ncbi:HIT family protein [Pontimicrobium sp. MEBiC01747]
MTDKCKICSISDNNNKLNSWDKPLFETENFYAVPSLGSLVEGWILIFSKKHYLSLSQLSNELINELNDFRNDVEAKLIQEFGKITIFEHGPSHKKTSLGCGVDHFHLHLVPLKEMNLLSLSKSFDSSIIWKSISDIRDLKEIGKKKGYLFLELPNNEKFFASGSRAGSQFFRRVIAQDLGISEKFDWKSDSMIENIEKTIEKLQHNIVDFV